jgi:hypothetical protein
MPSSIRRVLDELPTTLDGTYERALQGIPKEKSQHAHHLFQCLVAAIRPLHAGELAEIFAINFDADSGPNLMEGWRPENPEEAVLSTCSTLIAVIEDQGSQMVQFSHFSVKEYLVSDRLRTSDVGNIRLYHIPLRDAHTTLARACLTVLLQLDANADKKRLATFPLAFYAAQHWVGHAKFEDVALRIQDPIERLFDPRDSYLASWMWIHDADQDHKRSIDTLEEHPSRPLATALYYAALCGFSRLADCLIDTHSEDVNAECGRHGTPLHAASYGGHPDIVHLLLDHGADMNAKGRRNGTPLCSAYDGGHMDVMRLLLGHGAHADASYYTRGTLLNHVSSEGRVEAVLLLLQHNVNVNSSDDLKWTALHHASARGHAKVVGLLLEHGAEVNAINKAHNTPLWLASVDGGYLEVVQMLLEHGADVHIRGNGNRTAFQVATFNKNIGVAQLLLEHGEEAEWPNLTSIG